MMVNEAVYFLLLQFSFCSLILRPIYIRPPRALLCDRNADCAASAHDFKTYSIAS